MRDEIKEGSVNITKFVHACLLVEMSDRTAVFDPGTMSEAALDVSKLEWLDDIFITHNHGDHLSIPLVKQMVEKFPKVRITAPAEVVEHLKAQDIQAQTEAPEGVAFFDSPHEPIKPYIDAEPPQEIGVHYLDMLSHPGDSHSFHETKAILALPVQAPWGSTVNAVRLALELKPKFILPIHDWHWSDAARAQTYDHLEEVFKQAGMTFYKMQTGVPITIDI
jgi:L-ascorbate metabolism protein UlaG (beta-lactamase superfamily)